MITVSRGGQNYGPYSAEDVEMMLKSGTLLGTDLGWMEGMEKWAALSSLFPHAAPPPPAPVAAPKRASWGCIPMMLIAGVVFVIIMVGLGIQSLQPASEFKLRTSEAKATIRKRLKAPETAVFSDLAAEAVKDGNWHATGTVTAKNPMGVPLRESWRLIWNPSTMRIVFLSIGGEVYVGNRADVKKLTE